MMVVQHKLTIALVLSGVAHGLFLVGKSDQMMNADSSVDSTDSIELEFLLAAQKDNVPSDVSDDRIKNSEPVVHKATPSLLKTNRYSSDMQKLDTRTEDSQQKNKAEDAYTEQKKIAKSKADQNQLMKLVHQAISKHKRYPLMARRLGQQGRVLLNFVMHPDGQVTDVEVAQSSSYSVLDRAARNAVVAISPFAMASDYLDHQKIFDVAVEFRLN